MTENFNNGNGGDEAMEMPQNRVVDIPAGIAFPIVGGNQNVDYVADEEAGARPPVGAVAGIPNRSRMLKCYWMCYYLYCKCCSLHQAI